jgi:ADP-heptose:LPS heptosyltransferase
VRTPVEPGALGPLYHSDCRFFTGYSPCRYHRPCPGCPDYTPVQKDVLLINLDALGDVLRTTALLPVLHRSMPGMRLTWLTRPRAAALLEGNPLIDRVLSLGDEASIELAQRRFDLLLNVDKSRVAGALAMSIQAADKRGFAMDPNGVILPFDERARELYDLGLDDDLKFRRNRKSEPQLLAEALGFPWAGDPYSLVLRDDEQSRGEPRQVGFNTGCSPLYPFKKLGLDTIIAAIRLVAAHTGEPVLLLGGPEDAARNTQLAEALGDLVEQSPTDGGLRRGAAEVERCAVVVTGDSLGMHLAIARQKHVVAWFGVTCPQEIALYGRGVRLLAQVACAPCWKKTCTQDVKCFDQVDPAWILQAVVDCLEARRLGAPIDDVRGADWWR